MAQLDDDDEMDRKFREIRTRFVGSLGPRMEKAGSTLAVIEGGGDVAAKAVEIAYDAIHSICGMAATVGYPRIGQTARRVDNALVTAFRARRGLSPEETEVFHIAMRELAAVIRAETTLP